MNNTVIEVNPVRRAARVFMYYLDKKEYRPHRMCETKTNPHPFDSDSCWVGCTF